MISDALKSNNALTELNLWSDERDAIIIAF